MLYIILSYIFHNISYNTILVYSYHDLLGITHHPHYAQYVPSFCKQYSLLGSDIHHALHQYRQEVLSGEFPTLDYSPYKMSGQRTMAPSYIYICTIYKCTMYILHVYV